MMELEMKNREKSYFGVIFPQVLGQMQLLEGSWSESVNSDVF
jgi:hypothetical protein